MSMDALIKALITENLEIDHFELINDSHKHAGHAGDDGSGETHYTLKITSKTFAPHTRVERQRMVMNLLKPAFDKGLHALSLKLSTPED